MVTELNWTDQTWGSFTAQIGQASGMFEMILFAEFIIILLIGTRANKKSTGFSNSLDWALLASFVTLLTSTAFSLAGLVTIATTIFCLVITIGIAMILTIILPIFKDSSSGV